MPPRAATPGQMTLLDWEPPQPVTRFAPERVRGGTKQQQLARAIGAALKDADARGVTREDIAERMSEFLGERVSKHMLDAYASPARGEHVISLLRFLALLHATGDRRLLELLAEPLGWAVVEQRHVALIELAAVQDKQDELRRQAEALKRRARAQGAL